MPHTAYTALQHEPPTFLVGYKQKILERKACWVEINKGEKIPIAESDGSGKLAFEKTKYNIYPNPAYSYFTIEEETSVSEQSPQLHIEIVKPDGSLQMKVTTQVAHDINIMHLPPCMYLIHIQNNTGNSSVKKLIKMQ